MLLVGVEDQILLKFVQRLLVTLRFILIVFDRLVVLIKLQAHGI